MRTMDAQCEQTTYLSSVRLTKECSRPDSEVRCFLVKAMVTLASRREMEDSWSPVQGHQGPSCVSR